MAYWIKVARILIATSAGLSAFVGTLAAHADDQLGPGAELLERAYRNLYRDDFIQVLRVTSHSRAGHSMTRRFQISRKHSSQPSKSMVRLLSPPEIRGTSMLAIEHDGEYDDLFVYAPALGRIRRLSSAQRFDAFFATDFTYEDLEPKDTTDYDVSPLGRDSIGDTACYLIEARPRRGIKSQYERTVSCVDPLRDVVLRTDYYIGGDLWKVLEADPSSVRKIDGRHLPMEARMRTLSRGTETWLVVESYDSNVELPDSLFTAQSLRTGDHRDDRMRAAPLEPRSGGKRELLDRGERSLDLP